ncbi:MAG TPA: hypothetical protein VF278_07365 [Pirellulales bacterium]
MLVLLIAAQYSGTRDEPAHLAAGMSHWRFGDFALYRVNPPLVQMAAALPALLVGAAEDWSGFSSRPLSRAEFPVGRAFVAANANRSIRLILFARLACLPFALVAACVCRRWAAELYGSAAGLVALSLWCFCPIVLGHAALCTPDVAAAGMGAAACHAFWRWLRQPTWLAAAAAGGALGLAELTKFTWLVLFAVWPLTLCAYRWRRRRFAMEAVAAARRSTSYLQLAAMLLLAVYVINLGYAFQGTCRRLGDYRFASRLLKGTASARDDAAGAQQNRFAGTWLGFLPVPLPRDYVLGIDVQRFDFETYPTTFFRGEWRDEAPWWAYFYALSIKLPLGTLALIAVAALIAIRRPRAAISRDEFVLLAPAAAILGVACTCTGLNSQVRYVLPALPFLFIWCSKIASAARARWIGAALLLWSSLATLANHPHHLAYFNELSGASTTRPPPLLDSNFDWGQDLLNLERWMKANPSATPLTLAYYGSFDPQDIGIDALPAQTRLTEGRASKPSPGWYAISLGKLWGQDDTFAFFRGVRPHAIIGRTIFVYHVREPSP